MLGWFYLQVRLNSGIIHSPIHYRDVKTDAELEDLVSVGEEDVVEDRVGNADFFVSAYLLRFMHIDKRLSA